MKLDRVIAVRNNKTVFRDGDRCIKVFDGSFSKADILSEALSHARMEETGIRIPKLLEVTRIEGRRALVFTYIRGNTLQQLMERYPKKQTQLLEQMADLQLEVISYPCPLLGKLKDRLRRGIDLSGLEENLRQELTSRLAGMETGDRICHGDFNPSNIIIREDGTPFMIDWSGVTEGSYRADAAETYLLLELDWDRRLAEKWLELFCRKSREQEQEIRQWIPIIAASRLHKANERERKLMLRELHFRSEV